LFRNASHYVFFFICGAPNDLIENMKIEICGRAKNVKSNLGENRKALVTGVEVHSYQKRQNVLRNWTENDWCPSPTPGRSRAENTKIATKNSIFSPPAKYSTGLPRSSV